MQLDPNQSANSGQQKSENPKSDMSRREMIRRSLATALGLATTDFSSIDIFSDTKTILSVEDTTRYLRRAMMGYVNSESFFSREMVRDHDRYHVIIGHVYRSMFQKSSPVYPPHLENLEMYRDALGEEVSTLIESALNDGEDYRRFVADFGLSDEATKSFDHNFDMHGSSLDIRQLCYFNDRLDAFNARFIERIDGQYDYLPRLREYTERVKAIVGGLDAEELRNAKENLATPEKLESRFQSKARANVENELAERRRPMHVQYGDEWFQISGKRQYALMIDNDYRIEQLEGSLEQLKLPSIERQASVDGDV